MKLIPGYLNTNPCPPLYPIRTYTCEVIIVPKVCSDLF